MWHITITKFPPNRKNVQDLIKDNLTIETFHNQKPLVIEDLEVFFTLELDLLARRLFLSARRLISRPDRNVDLLPVKIIE